jgi:predicted HicB family RNase H-like nuclease
MRRAVDHYLSACEAQGVTPDRPFSGKMMIRTRPELHRAVALAAARERRSMNDWIERRLADATGLKE